MNNGLFAVMGLGAGALLGFTLGGTIVPPVTLGVLAIFGAAHVVLKGDHRERIAAIAPLYVPCLRGNKECEAYAASSLVYKFWMPPPFRLEEIFDTIDLDTLYPIYDIGMITVAFERLNPKFA